MNTYKTQGVCSSEIDFEMTYHEEDYAQIKWNGNDNPMRIWQVTAVSEPMRLN